jgi:hypothetical protein
MKLIRISDDVRAPEFVIMHVQEKRGLPLLNRSQASTPRSKVNQVGAKKEI